VKVVTSATPCSCDADSASATHWVGSKGQEQVSCHIYVLLRDVRTSLPRNRFHPRVFHMISSFDVLYVFSVSSVCFESALHGIDTSISISFSIKNNIVCQDLRELITHPSSLLPSSLIPHPSSLIPSAPSSRRTASLSIFARPSLLRSLL
jgi:hypothetical protein